MSAAVVVVDPAFEALGFAVRLGPIGPGAQVSDAPLGEKLSEGVRDEVRSVVGRPPCTGMLLDQNQLWARSQNPTRVAAVSLSWASTYATLE